MSSTPRPRPDTPYSYKCPKSAIGAFLWRRKIWVEATFALSMLEPWEKVLVMTIVVLLMTLIVTGLYQYMPHHLLIMQRRALYYLFGSEGSERSLWQWMGIGNVGGNAAVLNDL